MISNRFTRSVAVATALWLVPTSARADGPIKPTVARESVKSAPPDTSAVEQSFSLKDEAEDGWRWMEMRYLMGFFYQDGHGLQSQAGEELNSRAPVASPGSERAYIVEPLAILKVRQSKHITHEVYLPIDIVTAASPDGLDLVSHASATNESFGADITSTYSPNQTADISFRYGFHTEEPLRTFNAGPSLTLHLFEDNTVINVAAYLIADGFDPITPTGFDAGFAARDTFSANFSLTQVLSPTTVFDASVGITEQWGTLQTTYNSVVDYRAPDMTGPRISRRAELFPESRNRNAFFAKISQFIPATNTALKASYRFYFDETNVFAHTGQVDIFQYIVPWFYVHLLGRLHTQTAIEFWVPAIHEPFGDKSPRTSDSDLAALWAHDLGLNLVFQRDKAPPSIRNTDSFDIGYLHYGRSNGLTDDYWSFGYEKRW